MKIADHAELKRRAEEHQRHIDRDTKFYDMPTLARRWGVSPNTVRAIPVGALPYLNLGTGLTRERRRYHPDDVAAYEAQRLPKAS